MPLKQDQTTVLRAAANGASAGIALRVLAHILCDPHPIINAPTKRFLVPLMVMAGVGSAWYGTHAYGSGHPFFDSKQNRGAAAADKALAVTPPPQLK